MRKTLSLMMMMMMMMMMMVVVVVVVVVMMMICATGQSCFDFRQGQIFLFSRIFRPVRGPTHHSEASFL
jgi:hypothetical protein